MKQKLYQIDAFSDKVFSGNPAAVCPLENWLDETILQEIAAENNLAETAFYVKENERYHIRWFTPTVEVDLCGHATLAAAFVVFNYENYRENTLHFYSKRSGNLPVTREGNWLTLNFPTDVIHPIPVTEEMCECFSSPPHAAFRGKTDYMLVFDMEQEIKNLIPNFHILAQLPVRGVIVTAKGTSTDFVSRFFAPQSGIDEDPVTGSAFTTLIPYWSKKLGKNSLDASQLSKRTGYVKGRFLNERVAISGQAKTYLIGEIYLE